VSRVRVVAPPGPGYGVGMADAARGVATLRCGVGLALLVRPEPAARLLAAPAEGPHPVLRMLGARHLAIGLAGLASPTPGVATASGAVDGIHALSCLGLAAVSPTHRRTALRATVTAGTWLVLTRLSRPGR